MAGQQRQQPQFRRRQRRGPSVLRAHRQPSHLLAEAVDLDQQRAHLRPAVQDVVDLEQQRPHLGCIGQRQMREAELEPALHGEPRQRVGEQRRRLLRAGQVQPRPGGIALRDRHACRHRLEHGREG